MVKGNMLRPSGQDVAQPREQSFRAVVEGPPHPARCQAEAADAAAPGGRLCPSLRMGSLGGGEGHVKRAYERWCVRDDLRYTGALADDRSWEAQPNGSSVADKKRH